jgi:LPS sulfotransferase NodH
LGVADSIPAATVPLFMKPLVIRPQVRYYVLLFEGRTGSTFLTGALAQHPEVLAKDEKFAGLIRNGLGAAEQLEWARGYFSAPLVGPYRVRGFKTKLSDVLDPGAFAELLQARRARIILLLRRNLVKTVVSFVTAQALYENTGQWNLEHEADRAEPVRIEVPSFDFMLQNRTRINQSLGAYVEKLQLPTLSLYYEDLLVDQQAFLNRVCKFLGVRTVPLASRTKKHTSDNLRNVLSNFDELHAHYAGTPYQAMFDEILLPTDN